MASSNDELERLINLLRDEGEERRKLGLTDAQRRQEAEAVTRQRARELEIAKELREVGDNMLGIDEAHIANQQKALKLEEDIRDLMARKADIGDIQYKKELQVLTAIKAQNDAREDAKSTSDSLLKTIFGMSDAATRFGNNLLNPRATMEGIAQAATKLVNFPAVFGAIAANSLQLALEQDRAAVAFNRATGQAGAFNAQIAGLERSLYSAGVSTDEAGQAVQSLFLNMSEFTTLSSKEQQTLAETAAVMQELGINTEITAKNLNFATKALGMNVNQAAKLQRELFTFAQELGVSADKIASDFGQFGNEIAALGANGVDAFRDLQVASKSLGMEIGELLQLTKQFDRFDTAAESVGRLNALLGGPFLNAVQMVSVTDPAERLRLLKQGIDSAGISFDQMDYYQRKALASATGLGEAQLAMLMRGDLNLVNEPVKSAKELAELEMQTREFNTVMEELAQIGRSLMISFRPLIAAFKTFTEVVQFLSPLLGPAMLLGSMFAMNKAFIALNMTMRVNPLIAFASAVAMLAQGIYYGFSPSILMVLGLLAGAFIFLAPAVLGVMPALLPLAALFSGIAMAVVGLSSVFSNLFSSDLSSNLKIMSAEIATMVDKINELETAKAVEFTSSIQATAVNAQALAQTGATNTPAAAAATTTAAAASTGPPATINISLSIDGTEFQTAVNSVEATNYVNGQKSVLFDSIVNAFINNQVTTRGN